MGHPRSPAGSRRTSTSQNKELTSSSSAPGSPFFARAEDRGADLESAVRLRFGIGGIAVGSDAPVSVASPLASAPPVFSDGKSGGRSATDSVDSMREARGRERGRARWTSRAKSRQLGPSGSTRGKNAGAPRNRLRVGSVETHATRRGVGGGDRTHLERLSWAAYRAIWAVYVPSARIHTASAPVDLDVNFLKRGEKTKGVHTTSERGTRASSGRKRPW